MQALVDVHDTPKKRPAVRAVGVYWTDQRVPSQRSTSVPSLGLAPTAVQVFETQDTPYNAVGPWRELRGVGVGWMAQVVPFQRSAKLASLPNVPTAVQAFADVHDTANSWSPKPPRGFILLGVRWMTHPVPADAVAAVAAAVTTTTATPSAALRQVPDMAGFAPFAWREAVH
jgi:hypothetical protein